MKHAENNYLGGIFVLKITLDLKDTDKITSLDWNLDKNYIDEDYGYDSMLMDICNIFYDSKMVIFKIEGFGETWSIADCRSELPCILEQMQYIFEHLRQKEPFEIDFYEQGLERVLHFSFSNETVNIKCTSYSNNIPPISDIVMKYDAVKGLFYSVYHNFITCIEKLLPNVIKNSIFIDWKKLCDAGMVK